MTSLIVWSGADSHGTTSLYIAADSRISWGTGGSEPKAWDDGRKVFYSRSSPLIAGYAGDVIFPAIALPSLIDRIDQGIKSPAKSPALSIKEGIRRSWNGYPMANTQGVEIYLAYRVDQPRPHPYSKQITSFRLDRLAYKVNRGWTETSIAIPGVSTQLAISGSGSAQVKDHLKAWNATSEKGTSRAIYSGFVDAVTSRVDKQSGGSPQLVGLYREGPGVPIGIIHHNQRHYLGMPLIGTEDTSSIEWRNELFERAQGSSKVRLAGAKKHLRPKGLP